jgi:predicted MPP superfamily phosphohydrolase
MDEIIKDTLKFVTQKSTDAAAIDEQRNNLDRLLDNCKKRTEIAKKEGNKNSWLVQQFNEKIKEIKPLIDALEARWLKIELAQLKEQQAEDKELDALSQTAQPIPALTPTKAELETRMQSDIEDIIGNFEKQNPGIISGHTPLSLENVGLREPQFSQNPVTPILKETKFPESPGLEKIKSEEQETIEELRKRQIKEGL